MRARCFSLGVGYNSAQLYQKKENWHPKLGLGRGQTRVTSPPLQDFAKERGEGGRRAERAVHSAQGISLT